MREFGIVVFFCEYNKQTDSFGNYGFISPYIPLQGAKRDIYVRDKDADPKIMRNDIVTFEKTESSKGCSAKDVKKLKDDKDFLRQLITSNNEEEYHKIIEFIKGYNSIAYKKFQKEIISGLSCDDVAGSLWIWPFLGENQLKQIIEDRYKGTDKEFSDIFKNDKSFYEDRGEMAWFNSYYIEYIPVNVKRNIALASEDALWAWPSLDENQLKEVVKNRFMGVDKVPEDTYRKDKRYFENAGKMTWFCNNYFNNIPDEIIKKSPLIMDDLPELKKKELIKSHLTKGTFDYWDWDKKYLIRWPELFIFTSESIKHIDVNGELYKKFNDEAKFHYWLYIYKTEDNRTTARQQILGLLKKFKYDIYRIEKEIPDELISSEEALKVVSFDRIRNALLNSAIIFNDTEKEAILLSLFDADCFGSKKKEINEILESGILNLKIVESLWETLVSKYLDATISFVIRNIKSFLKSNRINDDIKILLLYMMAKNKSHNEEILEITKPENCSNKVAVVRLFYESGQRLKQGNQDGAEEFFIKAHDALLSLMQLQNGKIVDTKYLFPTCIDRECHCHYCEAKFYIPKRNNENKKEYAWCPRTRKRRDLETVCPHIQPRTYLLIDEWSLLEFLEVVGLTGFRIDNCYHLPQTNESEYSSLINPRQHLSELSDPREYIPRMAGGFNRLYEIAEHLKCRKCGAIMKPSLKFSVKKFAVYMVTRASCSNGDPRHDHDVYLNHCRGCGKIIDSRDDRFRDKGEMGYYICMDCGTAGPDTIPGTLCPNCKRGSLEPNMVPLGNGRYLCDYCGYEIQVPYRYR